MNIQKIFLAFILFTFISVLSAIDSAEGFAEKLTQEPKAGKAPEQSQSEQSERDCIESELGRVNRKIKSLKEDLLDLKNSRQKKLDKRYADYCQLCESNKLGWQEQFSQLPEYKQKQARKFASQYSAEFLNLCHENPENRSCFERAEFLFQTILFKITPGQDEAILLFKVIAFTETGLPNYHAITVKIFRKLFEGNPEFVAWIDREKFLDKFEAIETGKQANDALKKISGDCFLDFLEREKEKLEAKLAKYDAQENEENPKEA